MSLLIDVYLISGKRATLQTDTEEPLDVFQQRAQSALSVGLKGRLLNSAGDVLDVAATVGQAGLQSGDALTLMARPVATLANRNGMSFESAFAAILGDGSVVTWGDYRTGGNTTPIVDQLTHVQHIQASTFAFAAVRKDGSVVSWGSASGRGDRIAVPGQLQNVKHIQVSGDAFAAIREDGSVVTWGHAGHGGDSGAVQELLQDVQEIQASSGAFAAIREDGSVVTWGHADFGGDSSGVQDRLKYVKEIQASSAAFAAIREDGSVVTWGRADFGGDSSAVQDQLKSVRQIQATSGSGDSSFAAIRADRSVVTLGSPVVPFFPVFFGFWFPSKVTNQKEGALIVIPVTGLLRTWGSALHGGDSSDVQDQLNNVHQISSSIQAFAVFLL